MANTLIFLGYQPVWQDIFGTEGGDLREILRQQIDKCKGVVQLVGNCYGAEPPSVDPQFGRVSYTQYEALYAKKRGKKIWYLFLDEHFPADAHEEEPEEKRKLQEKYRGKVKAAVHLYHPLNSREALETSVLKLRDELTSLRRGVRRWATAVLALLLVVAAGIAWLVHGQHRQSIAMQIQAQQVSAIRQALDRLPEVEAQAKQSGEKLTPEEQRVRAYAVLEKELGLFAGTLARELPALALKLYDRTDTTPLMRARAAYALSRFDEAEKLSLGAGEQDRKAYESANRVADERRKVALEAYELAGRSAEQRIQYDQALAHLRQAEKLTDRARDPLEWANVQYEIAGLLLDQGDYGRAENILQNVVDVRTQLLRAEHPDTLSSRIRFFIALFREGKYAEAEGGFGQVIKLQEKVIGPEHPDTLGSRNNLATSLDAQGKYGEAEAQFREVLKLRKKVLGPEHPDTLASLNNLANSLDAQGKYGEAEAQFREVLKLKEKVLGFEHPDTLMSLNNLAGTLLEQGKYGEAEAQFRDLINLEEKILGPDHPYTFASRNNFAASLLEQGKYAEAEGTYRELLKREEQVLGPEHPSALESKSKLARTLMDQGKDAVAEMREVIKLREKVIGLENPDTLESCYDFASGLRRQGKIGEAKEFAQRAAEGARKVLGPDHPSTRKYEKFLQELK